MHVSPALYGQGLVVMLCRALEHAEPGSTVTDMMNRLAQRIPEMKQYSPAQMAALRIRIRKRLRSFAQAGIIRLEHRLTATNTHEITIHPVQT